MSPVCRTEYVVTKALLGAMAMAKARAAPAHDK